MASMIMDPLAQAWLAILRNTPCYASVHFEVPVPSDAGASEVQGVSYSRSVLTWNDEGSDRLLSNIQDLAWLNLEDVTLVGVGTWDAPAGGNLLVFAQFDEPVVIHGRGSHQVAAGSLFVRV